MLRKQGSSEVGIWCPPLHIGNSDPLANKVNNSFLTNITLSLAFLNLIYFGTASAVLFHCVVWWMMRFTCGCIKKVKTLKTHLFSSISGTRKAITGLSKFKRQIMTTLFHIKTELVIFSIARFIFFFTKGIFNRLRVPGFLTSFFSLFSVFQLFSKFLCWR